MGKKLKKLANTVLTGTEKARLGSQPRGSRGRSRTQEENIRFQRNVPDGGRYCDKEGIQPLPSSSNDEGSSHWTRPPIRCRGVTPGDSSLFTYQLRSEANILFHSSSEGRPVSFKMFGKSILAKTLSMTL